MGEITGHDLQIVEERGARLVNSCERPEQDPTRVVFIHSGDETHDLAVGIL
jgi:hypothetical protein